MLDQLAQSNGEFADEVRLLLFTFEDVVKLDDRSIQMVLKEVDQKDLAIALRGASDDVTHRIFANMSERGAELLQEEIDFQPPQRKRVIEEAQGRIVGAVRRLEEAWHDRDLPRLRRRRRRVDVMSGAATEFDFVQFAPLEAPVRQRPSASAAPAGDPAAESADAPRRRAGGGRAGIRAAAHAEGLAAGRAGGAGRRPPPPPRRSSRPPKGAADGRRRRRRAARAGGRRPRLRTRREDFVGAAVAVSPELVVEAVRGALRGIVDRERITVLVNPEDLDLVREAMGAVVAGLGGIEHCEFQAERRVGRGGAVVRTPDGDVDASVEAKLERAREVVTAALGAT